MSAIFLLIIILAVFNVIFFAFNSISSNLRKRNTQVIMTKDQMRNKLINKVNELNEKLENYEKNHVHNKEYSELKHRYDLMLNQCRQLNNKNKVLNSRLKKLKEKIY